MSGYVCNDGGPPIFVAQRGVPQGRKISFEELLLVFSKKSLFDKVEPGFILWLKDNVFSDSRWGFYNEDGTRYVFVVDKPPVLASVSIVDAPPGLKPAKKKKAPARKKASRKKVVAAHKETASVAKPKNTAKGAGLVMRRDSNTVKGLDITASTIIEASPEEACNLISQCKERPVLKKALALSKHFSGKETHMRRLIKRLEEVSP